MLVVVVEMNMEVVVAVVEMLVQEQMEVVVMVVEVVVMVIVPQLVHLGTFQVIPVHQYQGHQ